MTSVDRDSAITLVGWKREIFDLYRRVRDNNDPQDAWREWCRVRNELFGSHHQSPLPEERRKEFAGLTYFDYDPTMRVAARVTRTQPETYAIATSADSTYEFTRVGKVEFTAKGTGMSLELYWLEGYGGGLFLPFRDATSGTETYGAGRYLLDTIKGADLGMQDDKLVVDFNFAYNPSCAYDPRWVCPLAPPPNRLDFSIEAGERLSNGAT
jgi:uncharacterized protein